MTTYSVADAKARLPRLINEALAGEEVIISRHGKPVAELRPAKAPATAPPPEDRAAFYDWLRAGRVKTKGPAPNSVELLNLMLGER
jgi:prevent-host-death family protein